jgi:hypothetical protein
MSRRILLAALCLVGITQSARAQEFRQGHILTTDGYFLNSEYTESAAGYFIRNDSVGGIVPDTSILEIVTAEYFGRVRNSNPLNAALESLLFFDAAADYQWHGVDSNVSQSKDRRTLLFKAGLLGVSGFLYWRAWQSNERIKRSFLFVNDSRARSQFRRDLQNFNIAAGITALYFAYVTIDAYMSFGTDSSGRDLRIQTLEPIRVDDYLNQNPSPDVSLKWDFAF